MMRRGFARTVIGAGFACVMAACFDVPPLVCQTDKLCVFSDGKTETQGLCVEAPNHFKYCALPAADCASMWRWSTVSGDYSKQCLDPALVPRDAGADGAADAATDR